jgi:hypothetical protein
LGSIYYTGIGSRETPKEVMVAMTSLAKQLQERKWILRSGGADGADLAFERGAGSKKNIFIPWKGFNDSLSPFFNIPDKAFLVAAKIHPAWGRLKQGAQKLHARNIMQVTGRNLKVKSKFIVCWTPKGQYKGGTTTAMRLAEMLDIKVFNLYNETTNAVLRFAEQFEKDNLK